MDSGIKRLCVDYICTLIATCGYMKQYYDLLDGLRAYAVLGVLISHWVFVPAVQSMGLGFLGVNLFFVISGFLITEILMKDIQEGRTNGAILKKFYWRRTLRIFPIYYIACIILLLLNYEDSKQVFWYNVSYTTNIYNYISGNITEGYSHIWSLCVEEQFYLFWPLILLLGNKHARNVIILFIIISLATRAWFWYSKPHNYDIFNYRMTPACLDVFGLGAILAYIKTKHEEKLQLYLKMWWLPLSCFIIYCINAYYLHHPVINEIFNRFLVGVISVFLIGWAIYRHKYIQPLLRHSWLKYIGRISYGVYLYHIFVSTGLQDKVNEYLLSIDYSFMPALRYNLYIITAPLYAGITILLAAISYRMIELPFLRLKTKFK